MIWRLLVDQPRDGATNMAIDHALARLAGQHQSPPTLRLYAWQPICVSLGYFQPWADVKHERCAALSIQVVRRPTGGRAILHAAELTYAISAPLGLPGFTRAVLETYEMISLALSTGLKRLAPLLAWQEPRSTELGSAACFDTSAAYELTVDGRKLVGSAQTRTHGGVLQHGTILRDVDPSLLYSVLHLPADLSAMALAEKMIDLATILGRVPSFDEVAQTLIAGIADAWQVQWQPGTLSADEWALVDQLKTQRYANPAWLQRR